MADYVEWDSPSLAYLWDSQMRAIVSGANKLESLSEADCASPGLVGRGSKAFARRHERQVATSPRTSWSRTRSSPASINSVGPRVFRLRCRDGG